MFITFPLCGSRGLPNFVASQQILGLSCADSGNALFLSRGSFCCLVCLCYLPLSPISSSTPAPLLGRLKNARPRLHLGA